jgi:hypothetical protein
LRWMTLAHNIKPETDTIYCITVYMYRYWGWI